MATDTARLLALLEAARFGKLTVGTMERFSENIVFELDEEGSAALFSMPYCKRQPHESIADRRKTSSERAQAIAEAVNALPGLIAENERMRAANVKSRILGLVEGFNSAASVEVKQQEDQIGALENALRAIVAIQGAAMRDKDKLDRAYKIAREALNAKG